MIQPKTVPEGSPLYRASHLGFIPNRFSLRILLLTAILTMTNSLTTLASDPHIGKRPVQLALKSQDVPRLLSQSKLTKADIPNPHWQKDQCNTCHKDKARKDNLNLQVKDINTLCSNCHSSISSHSYIHPVNMKPAKEMIKKMSPSFKVTLSRTKGLVSCVSCHDLPMTCREERRKERALNPIFLRGGPYEPRIAICFQCHNKEKYAHLNPHDQIDNKGKVKTESCPICHSNHNELQQVKSIDNLAFNFGPDLSSMCTGCHPWKPHPGGGHTFTGRGGSPDHLVAPSQKMLEYMAIKQKELKVTLPMEPGTGKIFCGTCHNPHEAGIIKTAALAKGADSNHRLRLQAICTSCHTK
ncbi:MAG: hypothetical protein OEY67_02555 [Gammaproteobacteria bacterium]|nr:hypothetical protein [Gammaproteobacteria bacterium]